MPNIKSVAKDVKKSRERRLRNLNTKSAIKTYAKKTRAAIAEGSEDTAELLSKTVSVLDKAVKHGIIHPNAAARKKSRLMKRAAKVD
ncbi:MAG: 30S ribosomal protein S20 [Abditibacteriota bacterium]|nr:30S ribosomal protein S20 [Abditibacteriota bacterium]MBP5093603.1 30S ribosomal protein S20 [Abditibacteriota bacterium]MBP5719291.1 30S ribosomal protein S20 [Abditibacteriota bacterium]MBP5739099.1 30S ribosomal protein S20 [Abditibacteriota bacterium]